MHRKPEGAIASLSVHVIDDDPLIRETMRRLFEAEGWSAVTYESAEEFLGGCPVLC